MDEMKILLDKLLSVQEGSAREENVKQFYRRLSNLSLPTKNDEKEFLHNVTPKIYAAYEREIIKKDLTYFSLLLNKDKNVLQQIMKYDEMNLELDIRNPFTLVDYCFYKRKHWFLQVIDSHENLAKGVSLSDRVYNNVVTLKFLQETNKNIDIQLIKSLRSYILKEYLDSFIQKYIDEVDRIVEIVEFCQNLTDEKLDCSQVYNFAAANSLLETLSRYVNLQKSELWSSVKTQLLNAYKFKSGFTEEETFTAFCTVANVLKALKCCRDCNEGCSTESVTDIVEVTKAMILSIRNHALQLEVMEDIFALLFLRLSHFNTTVKVDDFYCNETEIRLIIFLLKEIFDNVKLKNVYIKNSEEHKRFNELNKYIIDSLWRLELVTDIKQKVNLNYMLASPDSLISMCLNRGEFERAQQVLQIFDKSDTYIAREIDYVESLKALKEFLKTTFKIRNIQKDINVSTEKYDLTIINALENFKSKSLVANEENEKFIESTSKVIKTLSHYKLENETFMNLFDLALTQPHFQEDCDLLLKIASSNYTLDKSFDSYYSIFWKKILNTYQEVNKRYVLSPSEILTSQSLDVLDFQKTEDFYDTLQVVYNNFLFQINSNEKGILNNNHSAHKIFLKLQDLCGTYTLQQSENKEPVRYLQRFFAYLKALSKILYIEQDNSNLVSKGKNASFFELLNFNRSEIIGRLLFEKNLNPSDFEQFFLKMKLDLVYHIAGNCFPTINLHTEENLSAEELYGENELYTPNKSIITYVQKRNWLLAFILSEMHNVKDVNVEVSQMRIQTFFNYMQLSKIQSLKLLFNGNEIITALQNEITSQKILQYFNKNIMKQEDVQLSASQTSNCSLEAAEEILEGDLKTTNWKLLFDIIDSIPENHIRKNKEFIVLKDMVLSNIVVDGFEIDYFKYVQFISEEELRLETILNNFTNWPGSFCIDLIKSELLRFKPISEKYEKVFRNWLKKIEFYESMKNLLNQKNWFDARTLCLQNPYEVLEKLLSINEVELLLQFVEIHPFEENFLRKVNENYLLLIFNNNVPLSKIQILLEKLPLDHSVNLCYSLLRYLKKRNHMQFVVNYLLKTTNDDIGALKNIQMALKILECFTETEQDQLWCLINEPLNIIEVLLMNTRLDKLGQVLEKLKPYLDDDDDENDISTIKIDELLREYAVKSLDFRIVSQPPPRLLRTPESKLMQSIDSIYLGSDQHTFVMPETVPLKDEWVQNHEAIECMCCQQTIFSMFNRRHHCRRCGRIICHNCSTKRMLVETYGDILVRVCDDCFEQTHADGASSSKTESNSSKSVVYDYWLLTDDPEHNQILRDEFSYEHAPSVSLCLAILKHHSKSMEYPKFLLDQCNDMLKFLQPCEEIAQEIDYSIVIRMLKSLAVAAKMLASECMLHWGASVADRILSQAELLGLLAERGCLNLLPKSNHTSHNSYIDASVLRKLRDILMEREQWNLALEVSTKAGLDNTGIFAAWGKCCLKAGSLQSAREKFQRCLDKTAHYESSSDFLHSIDLSESFDNFNRSHQHSRLNLSTVSESKPIKNPPLLDEIIEILESNTKPIDPGILEKVEHTRLLSSSMMSLNQSLSIGQQTNDSAICILNKLKNLSAIAAGNYYQAPETNASIKSTSDYRINKPHIEPVFYDECIYYLTRYGSHLSLLQFYIKHGEIETALYYLIENRLSSDVFIEVYTMCLKDGIIHIFQEYMSKIDSTLDMWKHHLRNICRHLEKQNKLNSLYQLQQFMGDYVRAAMTCIRFYKENVTSFSQLSTRTNFLHQAEEHLKQDLEQEQWVEVATVRKPSVNSQESFEEKGLTNPSLVMKMDSRNIDRHINTLWRQIEVTKFLAECEQANGINYDLLPEMMPGYDDDTKMTSEKFQIPTLFGSQHEKIQLAVFAIISGSNVEEGFGIAFRIIEEYKLKPVKVYCLAGKLFAKIQKYSSISQLVNCIRSSGVTDETVNEICDEMLALVVRTLTKSNTAGSELESLIKLITDKAVKISAYIEAKQLKSAYFLAVKYKRMGDIRRILREAELLNQPNIKALCQKILQAHSHAPSHLKD